ncbi:hypothetical protein CAEBREN_04239 [Caenorhabditis brenneri]|uniref:EF-hand domain-containing protein n=1 Tax=Caenorhabditis brenneri TaxID=135651 RepID=G0N9Q6_CAEBE|nr:hypothetical protein CAEBREN_04239 [Caenorhabditis brenneri]
MSQEEILEEDHDSYFMSNREFRNLYRTIVGDTKTQVNIRQAYTILNCSGRNIASAHLNNQWQYLQEKIAVDRLYDIYIKAEEVIITKDEVEKAMRTKTMKADDILNSVKEGSLVNKQYLEYILQEFTNDDGCVDIGALLEATNKSKRDIVKQLSGPRVEEDEEFVLKVRGCMTVDPIVKCISYTVDVDNPTFCEFSLSLAENSDVPTDRFKNDLFLVVYNQDRELVGLTRSASNGVYKTGMMTVNPGDEVMVIGIGTTIKRKRSTTERLTLIEENNKLSRRFRATLMNIFESFDVDQDQILNKQEMNFYTVASGDSELTDQDWDVYLSGFDNRDGGLTMGGFIKIHEMEAIDPEGNASADLWHSLHCLGYDNQLSSIFGCSYDIEGLPCRPSRLTPDLPYLNHLAAHNPNFNLTPPHFYFDYFDLLIAEKIYILL